MDSQCCKAWGLGKETITRNDVHHGILRAMTSLCTIILVELEGKVRHCGLGFTWEVVRGYAAGILMFPSDASELFSAETNRDPHVTLAHHTQNNLLP